MTVPLTLVTPASEVEKLGFAEVPFDMNASPTVELGATPPIVVPLAQTPT